MKKKYSLKQLLNEEMEQLQIPFEEEFEDMPAEGGEGEIDPQQAKLFATAALEGGSPPSEDSNRDPCLDLSGTPSDLQADNLPKEGVSE